MTSNQVRGVTWTHLRRRAGHPSAAGLLDVLERSPRLRVVFVDERLEQEALRWRRRHDEREHSSVDATSVAVVRPLRLREALAFDGPSARPASTNCGSRPTFLDTPREGG